MGLLKDAMDKVKARKKSGKTIGTNPYGFQMTFAASLIIFQSQNEIHVGKNRTGINGFISLPETLDSIIKEYFRGDLTDELTYSACWNVHIKEDLEEAIRKVLDKHNIIKQNA